MRESCWVLAAGHCWMLDAGCSMLDAGCWMLDAGCWMLDAGCWMLDAGCWMLDAGSTPGTNQGFTYFDPEPNIWYLGSAISPTGQ
jgi:hypothetical protein